MRRHFPLVACAIAMLPFGSAAQPATGTGPYSGITRAKVGGDGGFDYGFADSDARRLYIKLGGMPAQITIWDLDTLAPARDLPKGNGPRRGIRPKNKQLFTTTQL